MANPTCAEVLDALLSERSLTVSALAAEVGGARSTVSEAVGVLAGAGLVVRERRGRSTLVRLTGPPVAEALESLGRLSAPPAPVGLRAVTRMEALRRARTCYDHLAGALGVALADRLVDRELVVAGDGDAWQLTDRGRERLMSLGIGAEQLAPAARRPLVRVCQDWTERRPHVAGRVGAALCTLWLEAGLVRRAPRSRALLVGPAAQTWLDQL